MEMPGKRDCHYEEHSFSHGSETCVAEKCMICNDGEWEDRVDIYPASDLGKPS